MMTRRGSHDRPRQDSQHDQPSSRDEHHQGGGRDDAGDKQNRKREADGQKKRGAPRSGLFNDGRRRRPGTSPASSRREQFAEGRSRKSPSRSPFSPSRDKQRKRGRRTHEDKGWRHHQSGPYSRDRGVNPEQRVPPGLRNQRDLRPNNNNGMNHRHNFPPHHRLPPPPYDREPESVQNEWIRRRLSPPPPSFRGGFRLSDPAWHRRGDEGDRSTRREARPRQQYSRSSSCSDSRSRSNYSRRRSRSYEERSRSYSSDRNDDPSPRGSRQRRGRRCDRRSSPPGRRDRHRRDESVSRSQDSSASRGYHSESLDRNRRQRHRSCSGENGTGGRQRNRDERQPNRRRNDDDGDKSDGNGRRSPASLRGEDEDTRDHPNGPRAISDDDEYYHHGSRDHAGASGGAAAPDRRGAGKEDGNGSSRPIPSQQQRRKRRKNRRARRRKRQQQQSVQRGNQDHPHPSEAEPPNKRVRQSSPRNNGPPAPRDRRRSRRNERFRHKEDEHLQGNNTRIDDSAGHFRGGRGTVIGGRYRLERQVGMGTFGRVVECTDLAQQDERRGSSNHRREERRRHNNSVAIKVVRKIRRYYESAQLEADIVRFVNKKGGRGRSHVGVLLDSFTFQEHYCMVFESLGPSLYDFMKRHNHQPFPMLCVREIVRQVLETLEFLHSFHLIHTDLKPENILLLHAHEASYTDPLSGRKYIVPESPIRCKVIDFGGATYDDDRKSTVINTRQYRAPEVILGAGKWSMSSDLWSAGCIFSELALGELLFATHDNVEHLALIEKIVGPFPAQFVKRAQNVELREDAFGVGSSSGSSKQERRSRGSRERSDDPSSSSEFIHHRFDLPPDSRDFVRKQYPLDDLILRGLKAPSSLSRNRRSDGRSSSRSEARTSMADGRGQERSDHVQQQKFLKLLRRLLVIDPKRRATAQECCRELMI